ncbi:MAG: hypothetical protein ACOZAM_22360 [Pseudomonadota bacterium]
MSVIPAYYLDEPLDEEECAFVIEFFEERESLSVTSIVQTRVANILPAQTLAEPREVGADIQLLKNHLIRAGMRKDAGRQVVWVMPRDSSWGVKFQLTIFEITGYYPYVLQRWRRDEDGSMRRGDIRIIDGHGMMGGKD